MVGFPQKDIYFTFLDRDLNEVFMKQPLVYVAYGSLCGSSCFAMLVQSLGAQFVELSR